ncbi:uncharacterized protein LOC130927495 [Corythoichthys intestinalis]|uniref:uncharacterized protein LOC130927495 n=1 Tax=Corythoichthys intestinalis TaxID=161448 RepID=UPI0025A4FD7A|nr:uncharacterized protein LOC130927495 [Corythoichthys intestinalis]
MSLRSRKTYQHDDVRNESAGGEQHPEGRQPLQTFDVKSLSSRASSRPSLRSVSTASSATKAYAKAKAATAALAYAEKEADIMQQKANLEAKLHLLKCQKAAAAASAEAAVYEEAESGESLPVRRIKEEPMDVNQRTSEYVHQQSETFCEQTSKWASERQETQVSDYGTTAPRAAASSNMQNAGDRQIKKEKTDIFSPSNPQSNSSGQHPSGLQSGQDFAKYLIRREIISSGLIQFDDKPENYWSWKASFLSATKDLNLSAREELDLLSKWLGVESSQQAKRIRAVHILNPEAGARMVWQRLEESYGSPEVIEDALLKKVEQFPRLSNKDNAKLRELSDILLVLECAKEDGALPGLTYLDTARGIRPIVEKLPYNIQEKWITFGSKYKEDYTVPFPPFSVFCDFVQRQARIKNDPSFAMHYVSCQSSPKFERPVKHSGKSFINVHKTDIPDEPPNSESTTPATELVEPDRQCPIHKKPHPLKKCKLFRNKPLEERKTYLRDNRICYRCCGSTQHMAKDCKVVVKCIECNSERHISALHPGPPVEATHQTTTNKNDSGEQSESSSSSVNSMCTKICGSENGSRSCSKICLVKAYPAGQREKAVKVYAVLDEQSNKSLAKTEFFEIFGVNSQMMPYTLKTCSGIQETAGRRASNFILEAIDGKLQLPLPTLIECDMVPDDRTEIPSPNIALHHAHLQPIANKLYPVDHDAPILLLLGRDILRVHKVREQINGPDNAPYAQRLDLGWVIIGDVCLATVHKPSDVNVYKANILSNGRTSLLHQCPNAINVKEDYSSMQKHRGLTPQASKENKHALPCTDTLGCSVFDRTPDDNKPASSIDDNTFLTLIESEVYHNNENRQVTQPGVGTKDLLQRLRGKLGGPLRRRDSVNAPGDGQRRQAKDCHHPLRHRQPPVAGRGLAASDQPLRQIPDGSSHHQLGTHDFLLLQKLRRSIQSGPSENRRQRPRRNPGKPATGRDQQRRRHRLPFQRLLPRSLSLLRRARALDAAAAHAAAWRASGTACSRFSICTAARSPSTASCNRGQWKKNKPKIKVDVRIVKEGTAKGFLWPVKEVVVLLSESV